MTLYIVGIVAIFIKVLPSLLLTIPIYFGIRAAFDKFFWGQQDYLFKGEKQKWMIMFCASVALTIGILILLSDRLGN